MPLFKLFCFLKCPKADVAKEGTYHGNMSHETICFGLGGSLYKKQCMLSPFQNKS